MLSAEQGDWTGPRSPSGISYTASFTLRRRRPALLWIGGRPTGGYHYDLRGKLWGRGNLLSIGVAMCNLGYSTISCTAVRSCPFGHTWILGVRGWRRPTPCSHHHQLLWRSTGGNGDRCSMAVGAPSRQPCWRNRDYHQDNMRMRN